MVTYRVIHHQPELGLVLTTTIQHNITDEFVDEAAYDSLAFAGYITRRGELVRVPEADRGLPEYQDLRVPRAGTVRARRASPADWMLSFQVSKTLPLNGQINLWFFNAFDRRGVGGPNVRPRLYPDRAVRARGCSCRSMASFRPWAEGDSRWYGSEALRGPVGATSPS